MKAEIRKELMAEMIAAGIIAPPPDTMRVQVPEPVVAQQAPEPVVTLKPDLEPEMDQYETISVPGEDEPPVAEVEDPPVAEVAPIVEAKPKAKRKRKRTRKAA